MIVNTATSALAMLGVSLLASSQLQPRPLTAFPSELRSLVSELSAYGFAVRIALPPVRQAYGLYQPSSRTIWVSPLSFELGIARQTLLHEAVHAVQSCPSDVLSPIGWQFPLSPVVKRQVDMILYNNYHHSSRKLEEEAFGIQGQPNATSLLIKALRQRCLKARK